MRVFKKQFEEERSLYELKDSEIIECNFEGEKDGESPLKECNNIKVVKCDFHLRYPLWHDDGLIFNDCHFYVTSRAPIWYSKEIIGDNITIEGPKSFRECNGIKINNSSIISPEAFWNCHNVLVDNTTLKGEYLFFNSSNIALNNVIFEGKYSFQYIKNGRILNTKFQTKDAFWHSKGVTVKDSVINGEYLGWYSEDLTFINCVIKGTQPFCYCRDLTFVDCVLEDADLAFEKSSARGNIKCKNVSIKSFLKGELELSGDYEIIKSDEIYKGNIKDC